MVAIFTVGLLSYWAFTGKDVLQFKKDPIPVKPIFVKSEESVKLDIDFCKLSSTPGRVVQKLVSDKTELFAPTVTESQQKGCYQYDLPIPIPPQTPPGKYHVNYRVTYKTNPLHTIVEEINSAEFTVIE